MYTQCPDCSTAFRVSAEVLKQAAGKVRCGGCGNAFNALDYLSEQKPASPKAAKEPEAPLPELKPEAAPEDGNLPQSVSAEQSAALLKTLDELAGSDIRIEDTGVEWRVVDDDENDDDGAAEVVDTREPGIDEVLEDSPTPVDQFLTATPNDIEAAEVFEESANGPGRTPVDELRFDDNTPLPDDFDLDDESSYLPKTPAIEEPVAEQQISEEPVEEAADPQTDLDLSEPDEWEEILGEFDDLRDPETAAPLEAELAALEATPDDSPAESPEAGDTPAGEADASPSVSQELLDMDTQFALQAEAMGIDLSGMQERLDEELAAEEGDIDAAPVEEPAGEALEEPAEEPEVEALEEPAEEPESEALEEPAEEPEVEALEEPAEEPESEALEEPAEELVEEPQEEAIADAMEELAKETAEDGIDEPDLEPVDSTEDTRLDLVEDQEEAPLEFGKVERELAELEDQSDVFDSSFFSAADEAAAAVEDDAVDLDADLELEDDIDLEAQPDLKEELTLGTEPYPEDELDLAASSEPADEAAAATTGESPEDEHVVPPMSEEEETINRMIDQDLLSLAIEDEDGFASTIVIPEKDEDKKGKKRKKDKKSRKERKKDKQKKARKKNPFEESESGFETIIMEGENIRSAHDEIRREEHVAEAAQLIAASKAEEAAVATASRSKRMRLIGGVVALVIVLVLQVLHQSREALATIPFFNNVVGPVYRAIGKPLSPAWDITGWRIEATTDNVEEDGNRLVVYSRIGNRSESPLPYPIINISLTDRFEETLGSRQLDPNEYLPNGLDPSELVQPGNNFNAVISIQSLSADASGYRLDVCYRVSDGQLRCAIADFK